jgi:hypothetical protein
MLNTMWYIHVETGVVLWKCSKHCFLFISAIGPASKKTIYNHFHVKFLKWTWPSFNMNIKNTKNILIADQCRPWPDQIAPMCRLVLVCTGRMCKVCHRRIPTAEPLTLIACYVTCLSIVGIRRWRFVNLVPIYSYLFNRQLYIHNSAYPVQLVTHGINSYILHVQKT